MPPATPAASQNNPDVIDGPRKRRPSERVTDNGDPLVQKKTKTGKAAHAVKKPSGKKSSSTKSAAKSSQTRRASVEDLPEPAPAPRPQPRHPNHILEAADGSDDGEDDEEMPGLAPIEIDDTEDEGETSEEEPEDDETELRTS